MTRPCTRSDPDRLPSYPELLLVNQRTSIFVWEDWRVSEVKIGGRSFQGESGHLGFHRSGKIDLSPRKEVRNRMPGGWGTMFEEYKKIHSLASDYSATRMIKEADL